jgi:hypothetical protein
MSLVVEGCEQPEIELHDTTTCFKLDEETGISESLIVSNTDEGRQEWRVTDPSYQIQMSLRVVVPVEVMPVIMPGPG